MKKIIILIIASLLLIGGGILLTFTKQEPSISEKKPNEELPMGVSDDNSEEPWDTYLYKDATAIFNSIYNGKYDVELNDQKEYVISLQDFSVKYNVTYPSLNTESVMCDLVQSKYIVFYDDEYKENILSVDLKCTKTQ